MTRKDSITAEIKSVQKTKPNENIAEKMVLNSLIAQTIYGYPKPDFAFSDRYKELSAKKSSQNISSFEMNKILKEQMKIKRKGTISEKEQMLIFENACGMSLKEKLSKRKSYLQEIEKYKKEYDEITSSKYKNEADYQAARNKILISLWENFVLFRIYSAAVDFYVKDNKELIQEEMTVAKRAEIKGSLLELVEFLDE